MCPSTGAALSSSYTVLGDFTYLKNRGISPCNLSQTAIASLSTPSWPWLEASAVVGVTRDLAICANAAAGIAAV